MKKIYLLFVSIFLIGAIESNAQCSADYQYFQNNLTVQFVDSSFASPNFVLTYFWSFGDGNSSTMQSPSHTYAQAGTYFTCLTIFDTLGNCSDSICYNVTVTSGQPSPCMASYSYSVNANNSVNFFTNVTGGTAPYAYLWDFGNGPGSTATTANPTYNYGGPGSYGATLTVTDANGLTCTYYDTVNVNTCSAFFTYSSNSNGTVSFTNQSNPLNAALPNISWNFGDNNFSNAINPTHTYAASGTYIVTLNYFDSLSNCSATYSDSVVVTVGTQNNCSASYTVAKDSSVAYGVVLYNTSSNFASHFYTWDFGDGTTGSGRTPIHQYLSFGDYVVCLTITDSILNCTSTFCDTVGMDSVGNLKTGFGIRVVNQTLVGIDEVEDFSTVNLYPNPAVNTISIDLRSVENSLNVKVVDVAGRVVLERANQRPGNIEELEISNLNGGLYFMILDNGESQRIEKFIKQ